MKTVDQVLNLDDNDLIQFINSDEAKQFFKSIKWNEGYIYSLQSFKYCQITLRQVLHKIIENREVLS